MSPVKKYWLFLGLFVGCWIGATAMSTLVILMGADC